MNVAIALDRYGAPLCSEMWPGKPPMSKRFCLWWRVSESELRQAGYVEVYPEGNPISAHLAPEGKPGYGGGGRYRGLSQHQFGSTVRWRLYFYDDFRGVGKGLFADPVLFGKRCGCPGNFGKLCPLASLNGASG